MERNASWMSTCRGRASFHTSQRPSATWLAASNTISCRTLLMCVNKVPSLIPARLAAIRVGRLSPKSGQVAPKG